VYNYRTISLEQYKKAIAGGNVLLYGTLIRTLWSPAIFELRRDIVVLLIACVPYSMVPEKSLRTMDSISSGALSSVK
jgi:hypothetical protein